MSNRERFIFGARVFDVTEAKRILDTEGPRQGTREVPVETLTPLFLMIGVDPDEAAALPDEALDTPLIAITEPGGRNLMIDGYHRLHAANERGRDTVTMHVLGVEQSKRIETERQF